MKLIFGILTTLTMIPQWLSTCQGLVTSNTNMSCHCLLVHAPVNNKGFVIWHCIYTLRLVKCTKVSRKVQKCTKVYQSVPKCNKVYIKCTKVYQSVPKCTLSVQKCTKVYQSVRKVHVKCTKVYQSVPKCTKSVQKCTNVYKSVQFHCVSQFHCDVTIPLYTLCTLWYTLIHFDTLYMHFAYTLVHFGTLWYTLCTLWYTFKLV